MALAPSFATFLGLVAAAAAQLCPGTACVCSAGSAWSNATKSCVACVPGFSCAGGGDAPQACAASSFSVSSGATACLSCGTCASSQSVATGCSAVANTACICLAGFQQVSAAPSSSSCIPCYAGVTFAASPGASRCSLCSTCSGATPVVLVICSPTADTVCGASGVSPSPAPQQPPVAASASATPGTAVVAGVLTMSGVAINTFADSSVLALLTTAITTALQSLLPNGSSAVSVALTSIVDVATGGVIFSGAGHRRRMQLGSLGVEIFYTVLVPAGVSTVTVLAVITPGGTDSAAFSAGVASTIAAEAAVSTDTTLIGGLSFSKVMTSSISMPVSAVNTSPLIVGIAATIGSCALLLATYGFYRLLGFGSNRRSSAPPSLGDMKLPVVPPLPRPAIVLRGLTLTRSQAAALAQDAAAIRPRPASLEVYNYTPRVAPSLQSRSPRVGLSLLPRASPATKPIASSSRITNSPSTSVASTPPASTPRVVSDPLALPPPVETPTSTGPRRIKGWLPRYSNKVMDAPQQGGRLSSLPDATEPQGRLSMSVAEPRQLTA